MKDHAIAVEEADFSAFDTIIDTRSPAEYAEDHVPGAISAPVLDDAERAQVGTLYKQVSQFDAKKLGAALLAKNVAHHVETLFTGQGRRPGGRWCTAGAAASAPARWRTCCARSAGTRRPSRAATRPTAAGSSPQLEDLPAARSSFRVIHGPTGSGKSRLLRPLARAGGQVLDLEAARRAPRLGARRPARPAAAVAEDVREPPARRARGARRRAQPVFVEGESKKIGQLQVPDALMETMRASPCVRLEASVETRVTLLLDEYQHFLADRASLDAQLDCLVALHGRERIAEWKALAAQRRLARVRLAPPARALRPRLQALLAQNFVHLSDARQVRIASPEESSFNEATEALLETAPA